MVLSLFEPHKHIVFLLWSYVPMWFKKQSPEWDSCGNLRNTKKLPEATCFASLNKLWHADFADSRRFLWQMIPQIQSFALLHK
jgi:hypothetical protein